MALLSPWSAVDHADSKMNLLMQMQEGVMGRMQCLQSAASPPAHWSISSTRLHARPKADAVKLKVSIHGIDGTQSGNARLHQPRKVADNQQLQKLLIIFCR